MILYMIQQFLQKFRDNEQNVSYNRRVFEAAGIMTCVIVLFYMGIV